MFKFAFTLLVIQSTSSTLFLRCTGTLITARVVYGDANRTNSIVSLTLLRLLISSLNSQWGDQKTVGFNRADKLTKNHPEEIRSATVSISAYFAISSKPFDVCFFALLCIFKYTFSNYNKP